jgi:hypothetical protein
MSLDGLEATINLLEEGGAESRLLKVVILRRLVQFVLGKPVKLGSVHSSQLGASAPKHGGGWPGGLRRRVPSGVAAISFLRPETLVLLV